MITNYCVWQVDMKSGIVSVLTFIIVICGVILIIIHNHY